MKAQNRARAQKQCFKSWDIAASLSNQANGLSNRFGRMLDGAGGAKA